MASGHLPRRLLPARRGATSEGESGGRFCFFLLRMTRKHTEKEHGVLCG